MGRKIKDLVGQRFGKLTVIEQANRPEGLKNKSIYWNCICDCGIKTIANSSDLQKGNKKSCGCLNFKDLTGDKFNRLTVIKRVENDKFGNTQWLCICDCGNKKVVPSHHLQTGGTQSCGCKSNENIAKLHTKNIKNLTGMKFGKLIVISITDKPKEIKNNNTYWKCLCECGNTYIANSTRLISGFTKSCGCLKSDGEQRIINFLQKQKINYIPQFIYEDCIYKKRGKLKFDFAIINNDKSVIFLIEYDGFHHFGYTNKYWNTEVNYLETKKRDNIKNQYCLEKGIPLLRIPYWDINNIEIIINEWLIRYKVEGEYVWLEKQKSN